MVLRAGLIALLLAAPAAAQWPQRANEYRRDFNREFVRCGLRPAYKPLLAGQIEQESSWRADAESAYAAGLTQFTPDAEADANRAWRSHLKGLGGARNPRWALRAQCLYMKKWILAFAKRGSPSVTDRFGLASRAYNGGVGWVLKERGAATEAGKNPHLYDSLPDHCQQFRSVENCAENLGYWPHIKRRSKKYRHF